MRMAILGASGFVGSYVARLARAEGNAVVELRAPRLKSGATSVGQTVADAAGWVSTFPEQFCALVSHIQGTDLVVNCAGMATPESNDWERLVGANGVLPAVAAEAARRAGASTFIHVSSAAVQGRRQYLDETDNFDLISDYARSKALGERAAIETSGSLRLYIYRATSVQSPERPITRALVRYCSLAHVPVAGAGSQPLPLSLVQNTAAAITHLACTPSSGTYLHPWEGITVSRLIKLVSPNSLPFAIPQRAASNALRLGYLYGARNSRIAAVTKRLDLLTRGQVSTGTAFSNSGFQPVLGDEGYGELRTSTYAPH